MKICWADDRPDEARAFATALTDLPADIVFVTDGEAAKRQILEDQPDLVIVDLQMPPGAWGGLWLIEELSHVPHAPPALVLSGEGSQQETIAAMRLGAADYVHKSRVAEELKERIGAVIEATLLTIIDGLESETLEFKETLRVNNETGRVDKAVEHSWIKTVAAFGNSAGGTLVIGRADDGALPGIGRDLAALKKKNDVDALELYLRDRIAKTLSENTNQLVRARFPTLRGKTLAMLAVRPASAPVFTMKTKVDPAFYIRAGNSTRELNVQEAYRYIADRFSPSDPAP